jgi:FAD:protein FMN transferase
MSRFIRIAVCLAGAMLCGTGPREARAGEYAFYHENVMGTSLELRVRAADEVAARRAEEVVLRRIDRDSAVFSGYDPASEFSRWQAGAPRSAAVSSELLDVLRASDLWRERTCGAFDPRVEVLSRLWAAGARRDRLPETDELERARARMVPPAWRFDPASGRAERTSDCPLSLNGIAKGFIVERATDAVMDEVPGVEGVMLNVGGDLRVRGRIDGTIGIAAPWADSESSDPLAFIEVKDRSVATSGRSQRGFRIGGRWYSHVIDPRTGRPVERVAAATVIAERSVAADAFAKVCNVLEPDECLRLSRSIGGLEFLIVERDGRTTRSDGWRRYERPRPGLLAASSSAAVAGGAPPDTPPRDDARAAAGSPWNDFELVVNLEINRPQADAGRYRRPYVVVWVEDSEGKSVRTVSLWVSSGGAGPFQWIPDLKRWYAADEERKRHDDRELVLTVARPTRQPGKYRVIWDGKDDSKRPLPAGEYTVSIEAAREHGTYQVIRKKVTIGDRPFTEELKGNVEIRAASIEYRRKAAPK